MSGLIYAPVPTPAGAAFAPGTRLGDVQIQLPGGLVLGQVDEHGVEWSIFSPVKGWHDKPAPEGEQRKRVAEHGVYIGERWFPGRVVQIEGSIMAPSHDEAHRAQQRLSAAILHRLGLMTVHDGAQALQARVMQEGEILWADETDRRHTFSCSVIAPDPRKYSTTQLRASTGLPTTSGGLVIESTTLEEAHNLVVNPSGETALGAWSGADAATVIRTQDKAKVGTWSWRLGGGVTWRSDLPVLAGGTTYTAAAFVWIPSSETASVSMRVGGNAVADAVVGPTITERDQWVRATVTFTTDADGGSPAIFPAYVATGEVWVDGFQINEGAEADPYGDGDSPGWQWDGTPHASTSTRPEQDTGLVIESPGLVIFGAQTEGVARITNDGNFTDGSPLTMIVRGPCPPFTLRHRQTGRRISYGQPLTAGRFLLLDSDRKVALEGSTGSDSYAVRPVRAMWFDALPGLNEVEFSATAYDPSARLELSARHAWS